MTTLIIKVLEYTLFQPGLFLNYLATPHQTATHVTPLNTFVDMENKRAIVIDGYDPVMTLTSVRDLAEVVAKAVEYPGDWPQVGGIQGNTLKVSGIIKLGEQIRGIRTENSRHSISN